MRKFRYVGTEEDLGPYGDHKIELGGVYNEDYIVVKDIVVKDYEIFDWFNEEWQEVFEETPEFGTIQLDNCTVSFVSASDIDLTPEDIVHKPAHYNQGKIQCWDAIESATVGKKGIEAYYVGNIIKYLWRYENKGGLVDVEKAKVYLDKLIELKKV